MIAVCTLLVRNVFTQMQGYEALDAAICDKYGTSSLRYKFKDVEGDLVTLECQVRSPLYSLSLTPAG